jgi:predicted glycosyltransferase
MPTILPVPKNPACRVDAVPFGSKRELIEALAKLSQHARHPRMVLDLAERLTASNTAIWADPQHARTF